MKIDDEQIACETSQRDASTSASKARAVAGGAPRGRSGSSTSMHCSARSPCSSSWRSGKCGEVGWVNPLFTSSPSRIVRPAISLADGRLEHSADHGYEFLVGYCLAVLIGVPLGIVMGWYSVSNAVPIHSSPGFIRRRASRCCRSS